MGAGTQMRKQALFIACFFLYVLDILITIQKIKSKQRQFEVLGTD